MHISNINLIDLLQFISMYFSSISQYFTVTVRNKCWKKFLKYFLYCKQLSKYLTRAGQFSISLLFLGRNQFIGNFRPLILSYHPTKLLCYLHFLSPIFFQSGIRFILTASPVCFLCEQMNYINLGFLLVLSSIPPSTFGTWRGQRR